MPIPANATISARIAGGVRAALEAESLADALQDVGQNAGRAGRAAVRATFALKWMNRQLRSTFTSANLAATGLWAFSAAGFVTKVVALSLAAVALPALVIALWNVAAAAGVVTVALLGGLLAAFGAAGLIALGVADRFKTMRDVAGSAANDMAVQAGLLRNAFRDAIAPGADRVMSGIANGLTALIPLMRELQPAFTALGGAIGDTLEKMLTGLGGAGPELSAMFTALVPAITAGGDLLSAFGALLVQIATVGAPLLADALTWLADIARGWTSSFDTGTLDRAQATLSGFAASVKTFFTAFAAPIKPLFGPAINDMGAATKTLAGPLGTLLGTLVATLFKIAVAALPTVVKGVQWLARVLPKALSAISDGGRGLLDALAPAKPFWDNVLKPFLSGLAKGVGGLLVAVWTITKGVLQALGWLGSKLEWARPIFEGLGTIIGFVFGGALIKAVGSIVGAIPHLGFLGTAISKVGGFIQGVISVAGRVGKAIGDGFGTIAQIVATVAMGLAGAAAGFWQPFRSTFDTVWGGIKSAFVSVVNFLIGILNGFIKVYNGTVGKLSGIPGVPDITLGLIPTIGDGGSGGVVPSTGAPGSSLGDGPMRGVPKAIRPSGDARPSSPSAAAAPAHRQQRGAPGDAYLDGYKVGKVLERRKTEDRDRD